MLNNVYFIAQQSIYEDERFKTSLFSLVDI